MKALTYTKPGRFELIEKPKPEILNQKDAMVRVTLSSICSSDLHILHGAVPKAEIGITVGHELVGVVEAVGQAEYVRVPYADNGLTPIPDNVSDEQALFVGDILATGYWAAKISEISEEDTVLIIGAGPTGLCTLECVQLYQPHKIVVCEADKSRRHFVRQHYPNVKVLEPTKCLEVLKSLTEGRGADCVIEVAGGEETFELAWRCARPNAIVTIVALYEKEQILPLPWMYGKNLTFKTGGVDACDCDKIIQMISEGRIDTTHLITHRYPLSRIQEAYALFANRSDGVIKTAIYPD